MNRQVLLFLQRKQYLLFLLKQLNLAIIQSPYISYPFSMFRSISWCLFENAAWTSIASETKLYLKPKAKMQNIRSVVQSSIFKQMLHRDKKFLKYTFMGLKQVTY